MRPPESARPGASGRSPEEGPDDLRATLLACREDLLRAEKRLKALRHDPVMFREAVSAADSVSKALAVLGIEFPVVAVQDLLDAELDPTPWHHPREVLRCPSPDLGRVFVACKAALDDAPPDMRRHLAAVTERAARAHDLDETARLRREPMEGGTP